MAVQVHYVNLKLCSVDAGGNVIDKNANTTTLSDIKKFSDQQHRVIPRTTGPASTANSSGWPDIPTYLQAEADDGFALAYMDQYTIITQMIT